MRSRGIARPLRDEAFRLERGGVEPREAATLVAFQHGLVPVGSGWTLKELAAVLFFRATRARWR